MTDNKVNPLEAFQRDSRIACQYGAKCYQKNPVHHQKYKHPPAKPETSLTKKTPSQVQKRKLNTRAALPKAKMRKEAPGNQPRRSPTPSLSSGDDENPSGSEKTSSEDEKSEDEEKKPSDIYESPDKTPSESTLSSDDDTQSRKSSKIPSSPEEPNKKVSEAEKKYKDSVPDEQKQLINKLFLLKMPEDFYQFYEFCRSLSSGSPASALRAIGLELVGPYDVLIGKIAKFSPDDQEKYLRHWRYFYDPPEFQTIVKGNNKEGLHFGYWRDEDDKLPVFVARNSAMTDCKIAPAGETIFGAVWAFAEERLKRASPFDKSSISLLSRKLKQFAKSNGISLELESLSMRSRNRKSVAKTFHGAGIVVPYDKKTQVGYRSLAATDSQFKKILEKLDDENEDIRKEYLSKIEEMVRLATIAADECDFGTPLELAHDLFSSGLPPVERIASQMFTMAYNLLQRPIFSRIAAAHLKDRKKDCNLSVL